MAQTLASPKRPSPLAFAKRRLPGIIWGSSITICAVVWCALIATGVSAGIDAYERVSLHRQEAFVAAPRGMASRISLASVETGR